MVATLPTSDIGVPRVTPGSLFDSVVGERGLLEVLGEVRGEVQRGRVEVLGGVTVGGYAEGVASVGDALGGGLLGGRALRGVAGAALGLALLGRLLALPALAPERARHSGHPRHPRNLTALGHRHHHLAGVEEPVDELVDVGHLGPRAPGDARPSRAVDDLGVRPLRRSHRGDDRLDPVDLPLVEVLELLAELAHSGQHAHDLRQRPHLPQLLHLLQEVVEREVAATTGQLRRSLRRLLCVERLLGLLDQREHVAHVEDARGHPVRVEQVEVRQLLARGREHHRLAGDRRDRQGGTAARVTVELGEHHAVVSHAVEERLRGVHRVLADHRVDDEEDLVRGHRIADVSGLLHHLSVDTQTSGGVDDHDVVERSPRLLDTRAGHRHRVAHTVPGLRCEHLDAGALTVDLQLVDSVRTLEIRGHEQRTVALILQPQRELRSQGGLTGALESGEHDHGRRGLREPEPPGLAAEDRDELVVDDLDDLLRRVQRLADLLTAGPLTYGGHELLDDRERDIGLEQRDAYLPRGRVDVGLRQASLATEVLERRGETVGESRKHRWSVLGGVGSWCRAAAGSAQPRSASRVTGSPAVCPRVWRTACTAEAARSSESTPAPASCKKKTPTACGPTVATWADRTERCNRANAAHTRYTAPGRSSRRTSRTVASPDTPWCTRTDGSSRPSRPGRSLTAGSSRPSTTSARRCLTTAASRSVRSTSQTDTARSPWLHARADRTETRCTASAPATSAISPIRSPETTVSVVPSSFGSSRTSIKRGFARRASETGTSMADSLVSAAPCRSRSRRRTRPTRSATSPARQVVHA